ncbi:MAG: UDP-4-amino-4,6-dideoxy-N-acetyl-beta-L-altrosamine transaminase [Synergistaceae bacterium]|jgi:UDP-4-amino-4,6-dideoxy-N-acetyl-beta-L-altrosamine transaminase|nr:UDP-4-amino-4,6-dideoxy-N-acetyl-beta-L-altrosamine transaminase [Synergistaceae bacterium]
MRYLPYGHQSINEDDIKAVVEVLKGEWLTTGPAVERFESAAAEYTGASYAVSFSSGTAALHGAMYAAGVSEGDFVLVPPLTFAATSNSAIYCGARPLFADISEESLCLDPTLSEEVCANAGAPVKVLAPVSFAGYPVDLKPFKELAQRVGAVLIEDAAHAFGGRRGEMRVGREADMTVLSFHPVKHITTAEGGMVVTDSERFAERMRRFRSHGIVKSPRQFVRPYDGPWDNDMIDIGYNYRLSDVASALGASQIERIERFISRRKEIAALYRKALSHAAKDVKLPPDHPGHAYHLFPIWVSPQIRRPVFEALRSDGIGVQVHYVPVHLHTYYRERFGFAPGDFPKAEEYSAGEISLPIYTDMEDEDVLFVADKLSNAVEKHAKA